MDKKKLSVREITLFGMLAALTFGAKWVMAGLPNIEPVSRMVMIFGAVFGWKALFPVSVYVTAEILFYGLGTWNVNYLYVWPLLAVLACLLRRMEQPLAWAMLSGLFGLLFGAMCSLPYLVAGGPGAAFAWWIAGIPYDIIHCVSNFLLCLILYKPLTAAMNRIQNSEVK